MELLSFENFIEDSWDYVSKFVVSDDYWEQNNEFIRELTYELYDIYLKSTIVTSEGDIIERIKPKDFGRILEAFLLKSKKYHNVIKNI